MTVKDYDEQDALKFIRQYVGDEISGRCADDDIYLLIDTMFDYFDDNDDDDDFDPSVEETAQWVAKQLAKDKDCAIMPADVRPLVEAELKYEETLFDF